MANHASAEKRNRQRVNRTNRNRAAKSEVRTLVKKVRASIDGKNKAQAQTDLKTAASAIDKAATKGAIHPKAASRKIGRLAKAAAKLAK